MIFLQILGGLMVAAGLGGLGYCILTGIRASRAGLEPEAMQRTLKRLVPINLASVGTAALGLAVLLAGLLL